MASFGTPFTPTWWASWPWLWPWLASSGVARSGETFNSVAFGCISLHSFPNPHPRPLPEGKGITPRVNDVWEQCSNQRGHGVRGSCRWFGEVPPIHPYRGRMRGSRLHGNDGYEQCSNRRGYGVRGSCRWFGEVPPIHPYRGRMRGSRLYEQCSNRRGYGVRGSCRWWGGGWWGGGGGGADGNDGDRQGNHPRVSLESARLGSFSIVIPPLARTAFQEYAGVEDPHTLVRFGLIWPDLLLAVRRTLDSSLRWNDGCEPGVTGVNNVAIGGAMA